MRGRPENGAAPAKMPGQRSGLVELIRHQPAARTLVRTPRRLSRPRHTGSRPVYDDGHIELAFPRGGVWREQWGSNLLRFARCKAGEDLSTRPVRPVPPAVPARDERGDDSRRECSWTLGLPRRHDLCRDRGPLELALGVHGHRPREEQHAVQPVRRCGCPRGSSRRGPGCPPGFGELVAVDEPQDAADTEQHDLVKRSRNGQQSDRATPPKRPGNAAVANQNPDRAN